MIKVNEELLFNYWQELARPYSKDQRLIDRLFANIEKAYGEEKRFYHNTNHLKRLLALTDEFTASIIDITTVQFAIFYHDIEYNPGSADNEIKSAEIAKDALHQLNVIQAIITKVEAYILSTRDHFAQKPTDTDLKYFLDFDLSVLASPREEYKNYLMQIRNEYSHLPADKFKKGRLEFVNKALDQKNLFFTDAFHELEHGARQNLEWELEEGLQHIE